MNRLFTILASLIMNVNIYGQKIELNISPGQANDIQALLNKTAGNAALPDIYLQLTTYHLLKDGDDRASLDSAGTYLKKAIQINAFLKPGKQDGHTTFLGSWLLRKRGEKENGKAMIDKAIQLLQNNADDYNLTLAYLELTNYYDTKDSIAIIKINSLLNTALLQLKSIKSPDQRAYCIQAIKRYYQLKLSIETDITKLGFLGLFMQTCQQIKNKTGEFWSRKEIADIHLHQGKNKLAQNELLELLKEQTAGKYPNICFTTDLLAAVYNNSSNYSKALYYSLETLRNVHSALDSFYLPSFYARIASVYDNLNNKGLSLAWQIKGLNYQVSQKKGEKNYYIITGIIESMIKQGNAIEALQFTLDIKKNYPPVSIGEKKYMALSLGLCYNALNKNDLAEKYYLEMVNLAEMQIRKKEIPFDFIADVYTGEFHLRLGQYKKAEKYLRKAYNEWPAGAKNTREKFRNHFMFKLDSAYGRHLAAIKDLQRTQLINDSIFDATKSRQIEELKIAYETDEKDTLLKLKEQNILLLTKQDQLQTSKLRQAVLLRNITFAGIALLIIIIGLLYNRYRIRQQSNKKLKLQQQEIREHNISLRHLVKEKEWLVKEIHHRVKNNLQTVMGLLATQSGYLKNEIAINAVTDSRHRIHAMSLIHQKLYQSENLSAIRMPAYIHELVDYLSDSFTSSNRVHFKLQIDQVELDLTHCIPLGLIMNEAITNSFKYAFPENKEGIIFVSLTYTSGDRHLLTISDNGIGLPADLNTSHAKSMGINLMRGLSEELGARFNISNQNGTVITVSFVYDPGISTGSGLARII